MTVTTFDPLTLPAEKLLKLRAVDLFRDEAKSTKIYRSLVKKWHPDAGGDKRVFAHVSRLFAEAKKAWVDGQYPNTLTINKKSGQVHYPYIGMHTFELGELYICERHIIWATRREYDDLCKRWLDSVKAYKFPTDEVKAKVELFIPKNSHTIGNGDRAYTILSRPGDYIRLADILEKKGALAPAHVAWVISRAYHIAGFLDYAKIYHFDISPETFFVEPSTHYGALLGGWFYTVPPGKRNLAAPARNAHLVKSDANLDAQIRLLGRRLLKATTPTQLRAVKDLHPAIRAFLNGTPKRKVYEGQQEWKDTLEKAFGKRRFTEFEVTTAEIYSV